MPCKMINCYAEFASIRRDHYSQQIIKVPVLWKQTIKQFLTPFRQLFSTIVVKTQKLPCTISKNFEEICLINSVSDAEFAETMKIQKELSGGVL